MAAMLVILYSKKRIPTHLLKIYYHISFHGQKIINVIVDPTVTASVV
jgi:hypothetical protein